MLVIALYVALLKVTVPLNCRARWRLSLRADATVHYLLALSLSETHIFCHYHIPRQFGDTAAFMYTFAREYHA